MTRIRGLTQHRVEYLTQRPDVRWFMMRLSVYNFRCKRATYKGKLLLDHFPFELRIKIVCVVEPLQSLDFATRCYSFGWPHYDLPCADAPMYHAYRVQAIKNVGELLYCSSCEFQCTAVRIPLLHDRF